MGETKKLGAFFVKLEREPDGSATRAVTLTDDKPEWLVDAVHEAHCSDMPRDWIYQECEAACDAIDEGLIVDDDGNVNDDGIHEHADGRVDTYTKARYGWAEDMCLTDTFAQAESDAADSDGGSTVDMVERIGVLQYYACARIARTIAEAYVKAKEEEENAA